MVISIENHYQFRQDYLTTTKPGKTSVGICYLFSCADLRDKNVKDLYYHSGYANPHY